MDIDLYMRFRELSGYEILKSNDNTVMYACFKGTDIAICDDYNSAMEACVNHYNTREEDNR